MIKITIIGITGEPGGGKDIVSNYLVINYNAAKYTMSVILKSMLDCLYLPNSRQNLSDLAIALRTKFGNAILADVLKRSILNDKPKLAVISGIRYLEELQIFKDLITEEIKINNESLKIFFSLWYVTADPEIRYNRLRMRHEKDSQINMSWDQFIKEDCLETEIWIKEISKKANVVIKNNTVLESVYQQIEENIKKI